MTLIWAEPDPTHLSPKTQALLRAALQSGEVNLAWIVNEPAAELAARLRNSPLEDTFLFSQLIAPPIPARPPGQLISAAPAALNHPATQWSFQPPAGSPSAWQHLGNTLTWGGFEQPRENTSILLQSGNQPLLSVGQVGKGRVALFACGETWRWLTPDPQDTTHLRSALHIASLWEHLVEWLSQTHQAPEPPLRIHLPKTHWTASATMRACASVRGLAPDEPIRVEYIMVPIDQEIQTSRASEWRLWGADEGRLMLEHLENRKTTTLRDEPPRNVRGAWPAPAQRGEWALKARVLNEAHQTIGRDEVRFLVEGSTLEEASVWPDREGLEAAVSVAGTGGLYAPDEKSVDALIKHLEPHLKPSIITRERRSSAINANVLLALLILTLAVDAWLRRG